MSRHRQQAVRPRYGRIAALGASAAVTAIAVLGGTGILPTAAPQVASARTPTAATHPAGASLAASTTDSLARTTSTPDATEDRVDPRRDTALPAGSGTGYRVVFSQSRQRVWLVPRGHRVERTYLVSGSRYDNLDPGTYEVYSRSEQAWGIDDSGTMKYFVRFAHGDNAAIGFHDIPIDDGQLVQTVAQLGTPMSHGCIRQERPDAIALWKFAPLGTTVVVTK
ncbi:MAG: ErfK/YbiS/YcfS/YnhG family protein [Nocardioides sp.]|jgi:hypothetical protein|nr:ErfK/YbiS/YcfS/YnhG family protein [Nocardioides sp.]